MALCVRDEYNVYALLDSRRKLPVFFASMFAFAEVLDDFCKTNNLTLIAFNRHQYNVSGKPASVLPDLFAFKRTCAMYHGIFNSPGQFFCLNKIFRVKYLNIHFITNDFFMHISIKFDNFFIIGLNSTVKVCGNDSISAHGSENCTKKVRRFTEVEQSFTKQF